QVRAHVGDLLLAPVAAAAGQVRWHPAVAQRALVEERIAGCPQEDDEVAIAAALGLGDRLDALRQQSRLRATPVGCSAGSERVLAQRVLPARRALVDEQELNARLVAPLGAWRRVERLEVATEDVAEGSVDHVED